LKTEGSAELAAKFWLVGRDWTGEIIEMMISGNLANQKFRVFANTLLA